MDHSSEKCKQLRITLTRKIAQLRKLYLENISTKHKSENQEESTHKNTQGAAQTPTPSTPTDNTTEQTDGGTHNAQQIGNRAHTTVHTDTPQTQTRETVTTRPRDVQHTVITRSKTRHMGPSKRVMVNTPKREVRPTSTPSKRATPSKREMASMEDTPKREVKQTSAPSKRAMGGTKRQRTQATVLSPASESDASGEEDPLLTCHLTEPAQATRRRLLPLRDLSPATQYRTFNSWATEKKWAASTKETYWQVLMTMVKASRGAIPPQMNSVKKLFKKTTLRMPEARPTTAMTWNQMQAAAAFLRERGQDNEAVALETAFSLGQRLGDVTKLKTADMTRVYDTVTETTFTALTFRISKTAEVIGPYTLHLPADSLLAASVVYHCHEASSDYIFPPNQPAVRTALKAVDKTLTILSIRRGGLQNMARAGISIETLLHHSNHRTVAMLNHYLQHGLLNFAAAREVTPILLHPPQTGKPGPYTQRQ